MSSPSEFDELMARLQAGDEKAACEVFTRFVKRLIGLARSRLDSQIRQKEDPEDVVQSVFRSFFCRQADGQFKIEDWDCLWSLLALITLRKCGNRIEYFHAACRDVNRGGGSGPSIDETEESRAAWQVVARGPTPSQAAMLAETVEALIRGLESWEREIFSLRLQDYTVLEISDKVHRAERTVRRVLERVKRRIGRLDDQL